MGIISSIQSSVTQHLSGTRSYKYQEHTESQDEVEEIKQLCRKLVTKKEFHVDLSQVHRGIVATRILNASELTCRVVVSTDTGLVGNWTRCCLLTDNSVLVAGRAPNKWMLKRYKLPGMVETENVTLERGIEGMTEVTIGGKQALALSYGHMGKIEFREVNNLDRILHSHSVKPCKPGCLKSASPTMLLYADMSKKPREIRWLDCRTSPPQPAAGRGVIHAQGKWIRDFCLVQQGAKQLLVTTDGSDGLNAYDTSTDKLEWKVQGKLPGMEGEMSVSGITTDGRGHLYVCDMDNRCVQIFSTDGRYLGALIKKGEQGLGCADAIRWHDTISSLIVAHFKDEKNFISVISVQQK